MTFDHAIVLFAFGIVALRGAYYLLAELKAV